jgi:hypothetical protein
MPFQPVISQCGSLSAIISTYINYKLQQWTMTIPSYIQNSAWLLKKLDSIKNLPKKWKLFTTSDVASMYTNINPKQGMDILCKYLKKYIKRKTKGAQSISPLSVRWQNWSWKTMYFNLVTVGVKSKFAQQWGHHACVFMLHCFLLGLRDSRYLPNKETTW